MAKSADKPQSSATPDTPGRVEQLARELFMRRIVAQGSVGKSLDFWADESFKEAKAFYAVADQQENR